MVRTTSMSQRDIWTHLPGPSVLQRGRRVPVAFVRVIELVQEHRDVAPRQLANTVRPHGGCLAHVVQVRAGQSPHVGELGAQVLKVLEVGYGAEALCSINRFSPKRPRTVPVFFTIPLRTQYPPYAFANVFGEEGLVREVEVVGPEGDPSARSTVLKRSPAEKRRSPAFDMPRTGETMLAQRKDGEKLTA